MALELPLSIMDEISLDKSIANFTDGNITAPKSLLALGDTEFGAGARPHFISDWVGLVPIPSTNASLFTLGTVGGDNTVISNKCTCIDYTTPLIAGQTWDACFCWNLSTGNDGSCGDGCACARIVCNTVNVHSCNVTSLGGAPPNSCAGSWVVTGIVQGDCVHLDVFTNSDKGTIGSGFGYSSICMCESVNNVNVAVGIVAPESIGAYSCDS